MKMWISWVIALICLSSAFAEETCEKLMQDLDMTCDSINKLTLISSPNERKVDAKTCNAEYGKEEWQEEPKVIYSNADPNKSYTLMCIDPDPPAYEKGQYYLHWLVSNIKGEDFANGDLSKANHLHAYYGPAPPEGSGLHRYMFLALEEDRNKANEEIEVPIRRSKFELVPWIQRQQKLCGPVAAIRFRTQY